MKEEILQLFINLLVLKVECIRSASALKLKYKKKRRRVEIQGKVFCVQLL